MARMCVSFESPVAFASVFISQGRSRWRTPFVGPRRKRADKSGVLESAQYLNEVSHQAAITVIELAACASHCESINKQDP